MMGNLKGLVLDKGPGEREREREEIKRLPGNNNDLSLICRDVIR